MSRSHLLFKACGTLSPEEKLFIYSCINYAGTYQVEINHLSISWSQIMLVKRILETAESLEMMIIELQCMNPGAQTLLRQSIEMLPRASSSCEIEFKG